MIADFREHKKLEGGWLTLLVLAQSSGIPVVKQKQLFDNKMILLQQ